MTITKGKAKLALILLAWCALAVLQVSAAGGFVFFIFVVGALELTILTILGASAVAVFRWRWRLVLRLGLALLFFASLYVLAEFIQDRQEKASTAAAQPIIAALEHFHDANGVYPKSLDELIPAWLPAVPETKMGFTGTHFNYFSKKGDDFILFFDLPFIFPTDVYGSKTKQWHIID